MLHGYLHCSMPVRVSLHLCVSIVTNERIFILITELLLLCIKITNEKIEDSEKNSGWTVHWSVIHI